MDQFEAKKWAEYLDSGLLHARELDRITTTEPGLTLDDAYTIQDKGIALRYSRGERKVGYKMGLTSQAKREQMGLHTPIYGVLTDAMQLRGDFAFCLEGKIHPKIEPEIAFHISKDLRGRVTPDEVYAACSGVSAALEILDSRFVGFKYFSLPDVVADNSSSAFFAVGESVHDFRNLDLSTLGMVMSVNGTPSQRAISREISGHPVNSVVQLCALLDQRGLQLNAGSVVLAGAATIAVALEPGQRVSLEVEGLPTLEVRVVAR